MALRKKQLIMDIELVKFVNPNIKKLKQLLIARVHIVNGGIVIISSVCNKLKILCDSASPSLVGSNNSILAVNILKAQLKKKGFDKVYLQEFKTDVWFCNSRSKAKGTSEIVGEYNLEVDTLGPSVTIAMGGITAMTVQATVAVFMKEFFKDKYEICPGQSSQMKFMSRYFPVFILKQMSKTVDRMHANM